jgi:DNA helicase-2/ATP-dependent DNA helicase PcrA
MPEGLARTPQSDRDRHVAEERRLAYVAMTRAKDAFFFTSATDYGGTRGHRPSRFIGEALGRRPAAKSVRLAAYDELQRFAAPPAEVDSPLPRLGADNVLTVSYTEIDDYRRCPLRYRFAHVLRIPVLPTPAMVYGSALHRAVADFLRRKREGEEPTLVQLEATFRSSWIGGGFISPEHESERFEAGLTALRRFFADEQGKPPPDLVEQRFSFMLGNDRVVGQWDRVDRTLAGAEVADYKSSVLDGEEDTPQRRAAKNMQLPVYALAYQKTFGELPATTALIFLESGQRGEVKPTPDAMGAISAVITSTAAKIRGRQFAADPERPEARTCSQCPYNAICTESWSARQVRGTTS